MIIERRPFSVAPDDWAHIDFTNRLRARLEGLCGRSVCELGGGARPAIDLEFIEAHSLDLLVIDLSAEELGKAPPGYQGIVGDIGSPSFRAGDYEGRCDLVFSRALAEHIPDPRQFHVNVKRLLCPGGIAMHFFPTLWWPPFIANRVLPEAVAEKILLWIQPWRQPSGKAAKFPAYYRWCFGPTPHQFERLSSVGFSVEHCVAYFGESTHAPGQILSFMNDRWTRFMLLHPSYHLTSYAGYTLRSI